MAVPARTSGNAKSAGNVAIAKTDPNTPPSEKERAINHVGQGVHPCDIRQVHRAIAGIDVAIHCARIGDGARDRVALGPSLSGRTW